MSPPSGTERIGVLRQAIARIEAGGAPLRAGAGGGHLCEILPARPGDGPAACGYALTLAIQAAGAAGTIVWVGEDFAWREQGAPYGPGLRDHGLDPARLALVRAPGPREALWALEEALKSAACAAVIGEVWDAARHCDLAATRRLAVAARAGGTLGLLLYPAPAAGELSTAARERFEVAAAQGITRPSAGRRRPIPEAPAWRVRALKAGAATPPGEARILVWRAMEHTINKEADSDALPLHRHRARA